MCNLATYISYDMLSVYVDKFVKVTLGCVNIVYLSVYPYSYYYYYDSLRLFIEVPLNRPLKSFTYGSF